MQRLLEREAAIAGRDGRDRATDAGRDGREGAFAGGHVGAFAPLHRDDNECATDHADDDGLCDDGLGEGDEGDDVEGEEGDSDGGSDRYGAPTAPLSVPSRRALPPTIVNAAASSHAIRHDHIRGPVAILDESLVSHRGRHAAAAGSGMHVAAAVTSAGSRAGKDTGKDTQGRHGAVGAPSGDTGCGANCHPELVHVNSNTLTTDSSALVTAGSGPTDDSVLVAAPHAPAQHQTSSSEPPCHPPSSRSLPSPSPARSTLRVAGPPARVAAVDGAGAAPAPPPSTTSHPGSASGTPSGLIRCLASAMAIDSGTDSDTSSETPALGVALAAVTQRAARPAPGAAHTAASSRGYVTSAFALGGAAGTTAAAGVPLGGRLSFVSPPSTSGPSTSGGGVRVGRHAMPSGAGAAYPATGAVGGDGGVAVSGGGVGGVGAVAMACPEAASLAVATEVLRVASIQVDALLVSILAQAGLSSLTPRDATLQTIAAACAEGGPARARFLAASVAVLRDVEARTSAAAAAAAASQASLDDVAPAAVQFSTKCCISLGLLRIPVRSNRCRHMQPHSAPILLPYLKNRAIRAAAEPDVKYAMASVAKALQCPLCREMIDTSSLRVDLWFAVAAARAVASGMEAFAVPTTAAGVVGAVGLTLRDVGLSS